MVDLEVVVDILRHDLRDAARALRRSGFFAGITVLVLGLGIGVATAGFAIVNAVLLRPIAAEQDRVVRISKQDVERGGDRDPLAYPEFLSLRERARSFESLAAINYADAWGVPLTVGDRPAAVALVPVSAGFFAVLHAGQPFRGRWLRESDEASGAEPVAVASHRFWRRAAGGDPGLVGRRLRWAGGDETLLVVGVAPPELDYPIGTDLWVPIARFFDGKEGRFDSASRRFSQFELIGRLAPGASPETARTELEVLQHRLSREFPDDYRPMPVVVEPLLDTVVGHGRQMLLFLFSAAGLVFVIAGVNVAALLLMRAAARRTELDVRVALGASLGRLARQTAAEALVLGGLGALAGLLVARVLLGIVQWLEPVDIPRIEQAALDLRVLGFCIGAALFWVVALGTAPVWGYRKLEATPAAGSPALSLRAGRGTRGLRAFTIAQTSAAVVVAIGAGLLVQSLVHLQRIDRGFDSRHLAVVSLMLPARYHDARSRLAFYDELVTKLDAIPGVVSAAPDHMGPGTGSVGLSAPMRFEGQSEEDARTNPWGSWEPVMPSYFRTLGITIVRGRGFTGADGEGGAPVAVVSESVARRYWPGQDPLGKRLQVESSFPWTTVVGVAAKVRYRELTRPWLTVYFPAAQFFFFSPGSLVIRTAPAPEALFPAIRETIHAHEPHAVVEKVATMEGLLRRELSRPRAALAVTGMFALMAILLAAVGVYAVMSYEVHGRRHELAVRSALGASPARIFREVVARSLALGGEGATFGIVVAWLATRTSRSLLFEVPPGDPTSFFVGAGFLLIVVVLASSLPARRAATADPATLLRTE
jgi:predicted permease